MDGRGYESHVRQHSVVEIGHEIISTVILSLPLIQEGQLKNVHCVLVNCPGGLPKNSVDRLTDRARDDLKCVEGP